MRAGRFALSIGLVGAVLALLLLNPDGEIFGLSSGRFASAATLGIWAVVLGFGVIAAFRSDLAGALRNVLVLALAFVFLLGLYAFAPELRMLRDRIVAVALPGRSIAVAGSEGRQRMVVRGEDGHFHVDATVEDRPVSFLVDTGASVVTLDRGLAQRLGFDASRLSFTGRVMTAGGIANAAFVTLGSVAVGDIRRERVEAAVLESGGDGTNLLGMSFLGSLSSFEFRGDRLILTD